MCNGSMHWWESVKFETGYWFIFFRTSKNKCFIALYNSKDSYNL